MGAIDQGTTSTRVILYDLDARMRPLSSHQIEHARILPQPGWAEHDPLEIVRAVRACLAGAMADAAASGYAPEVRALGITNQRETTVVWDRRTGLPLHHALVWLDTRTHDLSHGLIRRFGSREHFAAVTGLPISTYFSAMKLRWLMDNVPGIASAAAEGRCMVSPPGEREAIKFIRGCAAALAPSPTE